MARATKPKTETEPRKPKAETRQVPLDICAQCNQTKAEHRGIHDHKFRGLPVGWEPNEEISGAIVLADGAPTAQPGMDSGALIMEYVVADEVLEKMEIDDLAEEVRKVQGRIHLVGRELILANAAIGQMLSAIKTRMATPDFFPWVFDQFHYSERHTWRLLFLHKNRERVMSLLDDNQEMTLRGVLDAVNNKLRVERALREAQNEADARARLGEGTVPEVEPGEHTWLYQGDARDLPMGSGMVDLIVTSPPYGLGLEGVDANSGYQMYLEEVGVWAQELYRVANDRYGRLCLNVPFDTFRDFPKCIFDDWLQALERAGWQYRGMHLWEEGNVSRRTSWGSFRKPSAPVPIMPVECILVMFKGDWPRDALTDYQPEVPSQEWRAWMTQPWRFPGGKHERHQAVFPVELPKRCILLYSYPGDVVLDPFVGVGSTSRAAKGLMRQSYGYDVNEEWIAEAQQAAADTRWGQILETLGSDPGDPDSEAAETA